jgi:hypothetical protein
MKKFAVLIISLAMVCVVSGTAKADLTELTPPQGGYGTKVEVMGSGFGEQRSGMFNATEGYYSFVTFTDTTNTMIATEYPACALLWTDTQIVVKFQNFFIDQDGDYLQDGDEPIETEIIEMNLVGYDVRVNTLWFTDNNDNDTYDEGDTINSIFSSAPVTFIQTNDPVICRIGPAGGQEAGKMIRIRGYNFGDGSVSPSVVHINKKTFQYPDTKIKLWSPTTVKIQVPKYRHTFFGGEDFKFRKVWLTVGTTNSNKKRFKVYKPATPPDPPSGGCTACH